MKKFLHLFLSLFIITILFFNFKGISNQTSATPIQTQIDKTGEAHKENWREALMEFADEDDTLDSLDYVPEFLK